MKTKQILVVPYDASWPVQFEAIRAELKAALGPTALAIEHVGSTAVPGLPAKPIIDIDVVIGSREDLAGAIRKLAAAGYEFEGNLGIPDRYAFRYDGKSHLQRHHLYVCPQNSAELRRHLTFREHLRTHPGDREAYGQIKQEAALRFPEDVARYLEHKGTLILEIYGKCGLLLDTDKVYNRT